MTTKTVRVATRRRKDTDPLRSAWHVLEEWVEVNRRQILIISGIAAATVLLFGILYYVFEYRSAQAQAAYAASFEKYTALVGDTQTLPATPGLKRQIYPDKETKFKESAAAFEKFAADYSSHRDLGRYYAAMSYLEFQPEQGVPILEDLARGSSEVTTQARLALAEQYLKQGDFAKAEATYDQVVKEPGSMPVDYLKTRLALAKERLEKPAEAAALYRQVVDATRMTPLGAEAEKGLQRVDPKQAAALPPKNPAPAPGSTPQSFTQQTFGGGQ